MIQGEELAALRAAVDRVVEEGMADTTQTEHRYRANLEGRSLRLSEEGFEFTGAPKTPPRHWGMLIAAMSEDEIRRKKSLTCLTEAA